MTENFQFVATAPERGPASTNGYPVNDVLDLHGLFDRCMGNLDLVERVLDKFEKRLPEELAELEKVLERGDSAMIAQVAHRIKGNSSNVSAEALRHAAGDIEDLGRAGRIADIPAHLDELRGEWRRYVDCRESLRSSARATPKHVPAIDPRQPFGAAP